MKNKKTVRQGWMTFINIFLAVLFTFFFESVLEAASNGKKWYFISLPMGIGLFLIRQRTTGRSTVSRLEIIREKIRTEGKTEEITEELENLLIYRYNNKHSIGRADRSILESDKMEIFAEDWEGLELLAKVYAETGKTDRAVHIVEQIHNSTEFHTSLEILPVKYQKTLFYLIALEIFMEAGDMNKTEEYLFEAKNYMETFKNRKDEMGASICMTHVRYQYLKGNYEQALQWLDHYVFPENTEIQIIRRELAARLHYALGDTGQSRYWLKQAEEICDSQWRKDKLYEDYENMVNRGAISL